MERLTNPERAERLMRAVIQDLELDLRDITVLTEAASGAFAVTALLAALAGAQRVFAVTRDSRYGSAADVTDYLAGWAKSLDVLHRIEITSAAPRQCAADSSLITNLGFVRPIDAGLIERLPPDAGVSLMVEPWECRPGDVDLAACRTYSVPVMGTRETHPRLQVFRYVGIVVLKLLLEAGIEVHRSTILVVGSDPFGAETKSVLDSAGARAIVFDPTATGEGNWNESLQRTVQGCDALAVVEYRWPNAVVGGKTGMPLQWLTAHPVPIVHVSGVLDDREIAAAGLSLIPPGPVRAHTIKVTTAYAGPRPVIDLHAAGLKVGELLVRGRRSSGSADGAIRFALEHDIAMSVPPTTEVAECN